jgi:hypothetical protein
MTAASRTDALAVARSYHDAWSGHRYEQVRPLLADHLVVETPINAYPTADAFAAAVVAFASLCECVVLLAEFGAADQAMLLYDMTARGLGALRVAEHFRVDGGRITLIRQVHDTVAIRGLPGQRSAPPD